LLADIPPSVERTVESLLVETYEADPLPASVLEDLAKGTRHRKDISLSLCVEANGRLVYDTRLFAPNHDPLKLHLFHTYHDSLTAGHQGTKKTYELISREYYWTNMHRDIEQYLANCLQTDQDSEASAVWRAETVARTGAALAAYFVGLRYGATHLDRRQGRRTGGGMPLNENEASDPLQ